MSKEIPSADLPDLLQALWWAKKGNWDKAHDIAQDVESSNGSWVHAYLHRSKEIWGMLLTGILIAGRPAKRDEDMNEMEGDRKISEFGHLARGFYFGKKVDNASTPDDLLSEETRTDWLTLSVCCA